MQNALLLVTLLAIQPWLDRPPQQWTVADARQLLRDSPWSKRIAATVARRLSEDELREGGQMGQKGGVGYDGVGQRSTHSIQLGIRWESALPVRLAEMKANEIEPPTLEGDGYRIAVYGVPGSAISGDPTRLGEPLRAQAILSRANRKKDVKPVRVEVFERENGFVVAYLFPLTAELTPSDQQVRFRAQIGRVIVDHVFDLKEMTFAGRLEL